MGGGGERLSAKLLASLRLFCSSKILPTVLPQKFRVYVLNIKLLLRAELNTLHVVSSFVHFMFCIEGPLRQIS